MTRSQNERAEILQTKIEAKRESLHKETARLQESQNDDLYAQKLNNAQTKLEVDFRRAAHQPIGLAAFLSKVSGMDIMRRKLHEYQDRQRDALKEQKRQEIEFEHSAQKLEQQRGHEMQMMELRRQERNQKNIFEREARSVEMAQQREKRAYYSGGYEHMPSVQLALKPPGRAAVPAKAMRRYYAPTVKMQNSKQTQTEQQGGS